MFRLALKMLFRDKTRYLVLLGAFVFSTLLMTQQAGIFLGLMDWSTATISNLRVPIWVMDPKVGQVNEVKPLKETDASRVRSVPGVAWAVPVHSGLVQVKLPNGDFQMIQLIGLDSTTLIGRPSQLIAGDLSDLRLPNAIMVDDLAVKRFKLNLGDMLELNDREARIVAIVKAKRSFTGVPYVFSTFERAIQFSPPSRKMTSFVLTAPDETISAEALTQRISDQTGLKARTEDQFYWETIDWHIKNTGIPVAFGTTVLLGFIVGIAVAGQTFYSFIVDHLKHLATFKAMGVANRTLGGMLLIQSLTIGLMGYGVGLGIGGLFGWMAYSKQEPPYLVPLHLVTFTFCVTLIICLFSCALGWYRVRKIEAGVVFRG